MIFRNTITMRLTIILYHWLWNIFLLNTILILMIDYIFYNLCSYFFFLKLSCGGWRLNHQKSTLNGSRFHFLLFPLLLFTQLLDVNSIWENIYFVTSKRSNYIFATFLKLKILIILSLSLREILISLIIIWYAIDFEIWNHFNHTLCDFDALRYHSSFFLWYEELIN